MRFLQIDFVASASQMQKTCGTHSRLPTEIALALLAELRSIAAPIAILTAAMNDHVNGHQTLPLDDLCARIPRRPHVYIAVARNPSGHTISASTTDQLTRLYEMLFSVLKPTNQSTDPFAAPTGPDRQKMCDAWRGICDRCLIALYEIHRLDIESNMFDPTATIEVLSRDLRDARSGIGLLYACPIDGGARC